MKNRKWVLLLLMAGLACAAIGGFRVWRNGSPASNPTYDPSQPACGHLCIFRVCQLLGATVSLEEIMQRMPTKDGTLSLLDLMNELQAIGFTCEGKRETIDSLKPTGSGGVLYVAALAKPDHFIVLHSIDERGLHVFDNLGNRAIISPQDFTARWTGAVLRVEKQAEATVPAYRKTPPHSPRIQVDKLCFDKGSIPYTGLPIAFQYIIRNSGDADLIIHDVQRSCHCITSALSRSQLAPGESTTLQVTYSVDRERGGFLQELVLRTNDPLDPMIALAATGYLYAGVSGSPQNIDFRTVSTGETSRRYLFVNYSDRIEDFQLLDVRSTAPEVKVRELSWDEAMASDMMKAFQQEGLRVSSNSPSSRVIEVAYTSPADDRRTTIDGEIVIRTNIKSFEELHFPVSGVIEPRVRSFPPVLSFGLKGSASTTAEQVLELIHLTGEDFEMAAVEAGSLKCDHPTKSEQGRLRIRFSVPSSASLSQPDQKVRFRLQTKSGPLELVVPVYFWSRS
jgi:predicted double-glycine peptidase